MLANLCQYMLQKVKMLYIYKFYWNLGTSNNPYHTLQSVKDCVSNIRSDGIPDRWVPDCKDLYQSSERKCNSFFMFSCSGTPRYSLCRELQDSP